MFVRCRALLLLGPLAETEWDAFFDADCREVGGVLGKVA